MSARHFFHFLVLPIAVVCLAPPPSSVGQGQPASSNAVAVSIPTSDRMHQAGWWPTRTDAPRSEYAGTVACAKCHRSITASYKDMAMSRASESAPGSELLRNHADLHFQSGPYNYSLTTTGAKSIYAVSDGKRTISHDLQWAFGAGSLGQTYVFRQGEEYFESQVSFYSALAGLDITTGHAREIPENLEAAAGRRIYGPETNRCFACHTTASFDAGKFEPAGLENGVTCEACHGPAANHIAAEKSGMEEGGGALLNPGRLDRANSVDFCGACHRTTGDVIENGWVDIGVMNARFQPYRLQKSACWESGDARLTCTSCHDPHQPLAHDAAAYDPACLRCHLALGAKATADHPGRACRVGRNNCITCHMPQYPLPGAHSIFTDHFIRVVKTGEPYPN